VFIDRAFIKKEIEEFSCWSTKQLEVDFGNAWKYG
jgi:hypothetical protein